MNKVSNLSNDLNVITAEINSYKQMAGQAIFEIGKRLKKVKSELSHGEFTDWCNESLNFSYRQANRYMKAYEKFSNVTLGADLSIKKMDLLSSLDDELLETPVETSTGEIKKPTEMTQREIEEYKQKLKEAEEAKKKAEAEAEQARKSEQITLKQLEEAENKDPEIIEKEVMPKEKERELQAYKRDLKLIKQEAEEAKKQKEQLEEKLKELQDDGSLEAKKKRLETEKQISIFELQIKIKSFIEESSPSLFLQGAIASSNTMIKKDLKKSVDALDRFTDELKNIIASEVEIYDAEYQEVN